MLHGMKSETQTVESYLASLPDERRKALTALRKIFKAHLPKGYVEEFGFGMMTYVVPLTIEPKTYNGKPLMYAALASQKNHIAVYLCGLYCLKGEEERFRKAWKGKKLDMGKSCIRAKILEDLDLDLIGKTIASVPVADFVKASKR
jgi:hypothetical protein